jgi:hypothetical protein
MEQAGFRSLRGIKIALIWQENNKITKDLVEKEKTHPCHSRHDGTCLLSQFLNRLRQEDCLSPQVQGWPEQHKETFFPKKKEKKKERENEREGGREGRREGRKEGRKIPSPLFQYVSWVQRMESPSLLHPSPPNFPPSISQLLEIQFPSYGCAY